MRRGYKAWRGCGLLLCVRLISLLSLSTLPPHTVSHPHACCSRVFKRDAAVPVLSMATDGERLITGCADGRVTLLDLRMLSSNDDSAAGVLASRVGHTTLCTAPPLCFALSHQHLVGLSTHACACLAMSRWLFCDPHLDASGQNRDPQKRLGAGGLSEVTQHHFFSLNFP